VQSEITGGYQDPLKLALRSVAIVWWMSANPFNSSLVALSPQVQ